MWTDMHTFYVEFFVLMRNKERDSLHDTRPPRIHSLANRAESRAGSPHALFGPKLTVIL